jgi:hypothetical protein
MDTLDKKDILSATAITALFRRSAHTTIFFSAYARGLWSQSLTAECVRPILLSEMDYFVNLCCETLLRGIVRRIHNAISPWGSRFNPRLRLYFYAKLPQSLSIT